MGTSKSSCEHDKQVGLIVQTLSRSTCGQKTGNACVESQNALESTCCSAVKKAQKDSHFEETFTPQWPSDNRIVIRSPFDDEFQEWLDAVDGNTLLDTANRYGNYVRYNDDFNDKANICVTERESTLAFRVKERCKNGVNDVYLPDATTLRHLINRYFEDIFKQTGATADGNLDMKQIDLLLIDLIEIRNWKLSTNTVEEVLQKAGGDGATRINLQQFQDWMLSECTESQELLPKLLGSSHELDNIAGRVFKSVNTDETLFVDGEELSVFFEAVSQKLGSEPLTREQVESFLPRGKKKLSLAGFKEILKPVLIQLILLYCCSSCEKT